MSKIEEVVLELGRHSQEHEKQIGELLEMIQSLQRNLTKAFKEQGFDFQKLAAVESSRRRDTIQNDTVVYLDVEEASPEMRDEIAKEILALEQDPRAMLNKASAKGSSSDGSPKQTGGKFDE